MKLRNKQTGEIKEWDFGNWYQHILNPNNKESFECTLSEFIDRTIEFRMEWENYVEPKDYWIIDTILHEIRSLPYKNNEEDKRYEQWLEGLGLKFETKEEAEKAVEKLKAWKRLKDKGFRFTLTPGVGSLDVTPDKFQIEINADMPVKWFCCDAVQKDLDDCFGGEE